MPYINNLKKIKTLKGIEQYIVTDRHGSVIAQKIDHPEKRARMVALCGKNLHAIGKSNFKFCIFSRKNKKNFFIFPVGNYYVGVIKQREIENFVLADIINKFMIDGMT